LAKKGRNERADFDTLKLARKLEAAGFSPEQAAGASSALAETLGEVPGVTSKEDVLRLEAKIEATKAEIIKWMFGTIGFQTIIILGAVIALARALVK
jgi:hypothetical protein